jgi:hypothetical protein
MLPPRLCVGLSHLHGSGESPVVLYPAVPAGGSLLPETMSPLTFPCDLLYIYPALRPPPPRKRVLEVPRSLIAVHFRSRSRNSESLSRYYFFRGSMTRLLYSLSSDLRSAASQTLSSRPMQDSLPAARYAFPDEVRLFGGLIRSFRKVSLISSFHEFS